MKVTAEFDMTTDLYKFLTNLQSPKIQRAAQLGLNEHTAEQRRQSVVGISAYTGVPSGRVSSKTKIIKAAAGPSMTAIIQTSDVAIPLGEYGAPAWSKSMRGAEATGWNVRRTFEGSFVAKGQVLIRTSKSRYPLKQLSMAVLPNELAKPSRPNVPRSEKFVALDLEKRVTRHVIRALGV